MSEKFEARSFLFIFCSFLIIIGARGANAGYINKISGKFWAGNSCYSVGVFSKEVNWNFLYYYLKNAQRKIIGDNLQGFIDCFEGVDKLIILPVYAVGESAIPIDFQKLFSKYQPIFADSIMRQGDTLLLMKEKETIGRLENGIVVGFNAGNLTYALRGGI